ncbi:Uncharacterised protein [Mycobacteroides abscessus]|nr:Uncharacterised protein [Mycobacteroides abscessus]
MAGKGGPERVDTSVATHAGYVVGGEHVFVRHEQRRNGILARDAAIHWAAGGEECAGDVAADACCSAPTAAVGWDRAADRIGDRWCSRLPQRGTDLPTHAVLQALQSRLHTRLDNRLQRFLVEFGVGLLDDIDELFTHGVELGVDAGECPVKQGARVGEHASAGVEGLAVVGGEFSCVAAGAGEVLDIQAHGLGKCQRVAFLDELIELGVGGVLRVPGLLAEPGHCAHDVACDV